MNHHEESWFDPQTEGHADAEDPWADAEEHTPEEVEELRRLEAEARDEGNEVRARHPPNPEVTPGCRRVRHGDRDWEASFSVVLTKDGWLLRDEDWHTRVPQIIVHPPGWPQERQYSEGGYFFQHLANRKVDLFNHFIL